MHEAPQRERWLVAVFPNETTARNAARRSREAGATPESVRIGNSLDALASVEGEMREETAHLLAAPAPFTRESARGFSFGTVIGAILGVALALPFAAIEMGDLELSTRLIILGVVGLVFGSFLGWFIGGAIGIKRPDEPAAAAVGVTLAVPDSEAARLLLRDAGAIRIDVTGSDGQPLDTLISDDPGPSAIGRQLKQHAREEPQPD
jgi:hypothetical protein